MWFCGPSLPEDCAFLKSRGFLIWTLIPCHSLHLDFITTAGSILLLDPTCSRSPKVKTPFLRSLQPSSYIIWSLRCDSPSLLHLQDKFHSDFPSLDHPDQGHNNDYYNMNERQGRTPSPGHPLQQGYHHEDTGPYGRPAQSPGNLEIPMGPGRHTPSDRLQPQPSVGSQYARAVDIFLDILR